MRRIIVGFLLALVPHFLLAQKECRQDDYFLQTPSNNNRIQEADRVSVARTSQLIAFASLPEEGDIVIPVVVHLIQSPNSENITNEQVYSQIEALNRDFNGTNPDLLSVPAYFSDKVATMGFRFELAKVDPGGSICNGIVRKKSGIKSFGLDDRVKFSAKGGDDAWPRDHYLNIWVCNFTAGIRGYCSSLGCSPELDGVAISEAAFGTLGRHAPYNMGRVAVHEIGHWLGLKHIWGDGYCGDDGIDDTPKQKGYNRGCPEGILTSCGTEATGDMYMNFMDLTNDPCMFMFTNGQKKRSRSLFEPGGERAALLQSLGLVAQGEPINRFWGRENLENTVSVKCVVSPVPAGNTVRIEFRDISAIGSRQLLITNMLGQVVRKVNMEGRSTVLDISGLKSGQYLLKSENAALPAARFVKL